MLLSVVIPVYNGSSRLRECMLSLAPLLAECDVEVVVVDDGSDAAEAGAIRQMVGSTEGKVKLCRCQHKGAGAARNYGKEHASGDFLWFVDADDTIVADGIGMVTETLKTFPGDANVLYMGAMHNLRRSSDVPMPFIPLLQATEDADISRMLFPHTSALDHTTFIVRRNWLLSRPEVRYDEGMTIMEDAVFSLMVLENAGKMRYNSTFRFYVRHSCQPSATSGAWTAERSRRNVGDICRFFTLFVGFVERHAGCGSIMPLYRRYRYVYLRVLAVKGCPWSDIMRFRATVEPLSHPWDWKEWLLFNPLFHRLFAFTCRLFRRKR